MLLANGTFQDIINGWRINIKASSVGCHECLNRKCNVWMFSVMQYAGGSSNINVSCSVLKLQSVALVLFR